MTDDARGSPEHLEWDDGATGRDGTERGERREGDSTTGGGARTDEASPDRARDADGGAGQTAEAELCRVSDPSCEVCQ